MLATTAHFYCISHMPQTRNKYAKRFYKDFITKIVISATAAREHYARRVLMSES